jgi:hypothetical protein
LKISLTFTAKGDYYGTFGAGALGEVYPHFSDGTHGKRGRKTKIEESLEKRNILTQPAKVGGFGFVGTKLGGQAAEHKYIGRDGLQKKEERVILCCYVEDPYDARRDDSRKKIAEHHRLLGEKKEFRSMCHAVDFFDAMEHTAASKVC